MAALMANSITTSGSFLQLCYRWMIRRQQSLQRAYLQDLQLKPDDAYLSCESSPRLLSRVLGTCF
jgi:hypothetical protein